MSLFYSKTTGGFYDSTIHGNSMPTDATEITQAEHTALLEAQSQGKLIQADPSGKPVAVVPTVTMAQVREAKKAEIRTAYEADANLPVTVGTIVYQGGFDSAIKLDAARRMSEAAGLTNVTFYDATNAAQVLTLAEALGVVLTVASAFQTALARKQVAMLKVDDPVNDTEAKINAITY